ncbi:MAG: MurT ligase domain-containing protein [Erysipelotrichaceae bacterium]|nr:MurT ligase domain-containing protein [Erysipelotrichaceae bacterium]
MRKLLAIITCKVLRVVGKALGKGSSLPGKWALKIDKNILSEVKLPKYVIAVTGSNGKTSTVEMIKQIMENAGLKVAVNSEGSNQIEGVTTLLLSNCNLSGEVKADAVLLESDERYARHSFKHFIPTHYVITNLYRDQLTRNGHHEWIYDIIQDSIHEGSKLILNCDDPLINSYATSSNVYFGIDRYKDSTDINTSVYDDGAYCPKCKGKMRYEYRHYNHIGKYECTACDYKRHEPDYKITDVNLDDGYLIIDEKYRINLALKSIYNAYNILAAYALCRELNIKSETIVESLNNYILKNGRVVEFTINGKRGTLLTSKHENSISYNQSLRVAANYKGYVTAIIMVDAISRKYFTSETSWLWDIDFDFLGSDNIKEVILCGQYASDLAERLQYAKMNFNKVHIEKDIPKAIEYLGEEAIGHIFAITCFSDQHKLLNRVEIVK